MLEGGDPVDKSKLTVKITVNDKDSTILYFGKAVTELSGNLDFKTIYTLTLNPKHDATEVIVELQLIYDNNLITTAEGKCTFTWSNAMDDITEQLFKAIDSGTCQEALNILKSPQRTQVQANSTYVGTYNAGYLLEFLHVPYRKVGTPGNINDPTYESLCKEILTLPGIDVNQPISADGNYPLGQAIQEGNLIYMKVLLTNPNARINSNSVVPHM